MLIVFALMGCPFVSDDGFEEVQDVDGDGFDAERFEGRDCDDNDPAIGDCDLDRDGFLSAAVGGPDCDDTSSAVHPDADEVCDGLDNDCDGRVDDADDNVVGQRAFFLDQDDDGYGTGEALARCVAPANRVEASGDCDDSSSTVNPGVAETCDSVDRNCDGDPLAGAVRDWFADEDGDGFGDPTALLATTCDRPNAAAVTNPFDCNDADPNAHPASLQTGLTDEICDGIDNDCDGFTDLDDPDLDASVATFGHPDLDGDGYGDGSVPQALVCAGVTDGTDCNDTDATINPGATERCDTTGPNGIDGVDEDCDGVQGSTDPDNDGTIVWFRDQDGDGFGVGSDPRVMCDDTGLADFSPTPGDCNDQDATVQADVLWYADDDADGFGDADAQGTASCFQPTVGDVRDNSDCDDADPSIRPGVTEICDGIDNNCDDLPDNDAPDALFGFLDTDGDGFGTNTQSSPQFQCPVAGAGIVANNTDCDDDRSDIFPGAAEDCGGLDLNCNGLDDEDDPRIVLDVWYRDQDLDGFGEQDGPTLEQCDAPLGYVTRDDDCDDDAPLNYFSTYVGAPAAQAGPSGVKVDDLQEVLGNPGRCRPRTLISGTTIRERTVVRLDPSVPFFVDERRGLLAIDAFTTIALQPPAGERATVCWDPTVSVAVEGTLELERIDLVFGVPSTDTTSPDTCVPTTAPVSASPFVLLGHPADLEGEHRDESRVVLSEVSFDTGLVFDAPLVTDLGGGPNLSTSDLGSLTVERMSLTDVTFNAGLLDVEVFPMGVDLFQLEFVDSASTAPLLQVDTSDFTLGHVALEDLQFRRTSLPDGLFVSNASGQVRVSARRLDVRPDAGDPTLPNHAPLFCIGTNGCAATGSASSGSIVLDVRESNLHDHALAHLSAGADFDTTAVHGGPGVSTTDWVTIVGTPASPTTGWSSARDRLAGDVTLTASSLNHRFSSTHVAGDLTLTDPTGSVEVIGASIVGGALTFDTQTASPRGVVLVDGATVAGLSPTATFGTTANPAFYTVNSVDPGHCGVACPDLDPNTVELLVYPNADPTLVVPFPRAAFPTVEEPDLNLSFDGVPWALDPNTDLLPTAWLLLQAAHPTCWPFGTDVFNARTNVTVNSDPDGDGRTNVFEAANGTWPCIAD